MTPTGLLMAEHRLIERMIKVLGAGVAGMRAGNANPELVRTAVDFFRIYADKTHHGKEEDILFRDMLTKPLSAEHRATVTLLVDEHNWARPAIKRMAEANERYIRGEKAVLDEVGKVMAALVEFYPLHIQKEETYCFHPSREYFSAGETETMLKEFYDWDMKMIHDKYRQVVDGLEQTKA